MHYKFSYSVGKGKTQKALIVAAAKKKKKKKKKFISVYVIGTTCYDKCFWFQVIPITHQKAGTRGCS